jgi:hypothetical protein
MNFWNSPGIRRLFLLEKKKKRKIVVSQVFSKISKRQGNRSCYATTRLIDKAWRHDLLSSLTDLSSTTKPHQHEDERLTLREVQLSLVEMEKASRQISFEIVFPQLPKISDRTQLTSFSQSNSINDFPELRK